MMCRYLGLLGRGGGDVVLRGEVQFGCLQCFRIAEQQLCGVSNRLWSH